MTKTYCDRCLKEIPSEECITAISKYNSYINDVNHPTRIGDICPDCLEQLREWMKGEK